MTTKSIERLVVLARVLGNAAVEYEEERHIVGYPAGVQSLATPAEVVYTRISKLYEERKMNLAWLHNNQEEKG